MQNAELNLPDLRGQEPEDAKQRLRQLIRESRQRLNETQIQEAGEQIRQRILGLAQEHHTVAIYVSVNQEPATLQTLEDLYQSGKQVLVPKLGPMLARNWAYYAGAADLADLSPNRRKEPSGEAFESAILERADLVITPALAVDQQGNRLGQGGGWYDRALPFVKPGTPIYALCYDAELVSITLPTGQFDVPVNGVITPNHCFAVNGAPFPV